MCWGGKVKWKTSRPAETWQPGWVFQISNHTRWLEDIFYGKKLQYSLAMIPGAFPLYNSTQSKYTHSIYEPSQCLLALSEEKALKVTICNLVSLIKASTVLTVDICWHLLEIWFNSTSAPAESSVSSRKKENTRPYFLCRGAVWSKMHLMPVWGWSVVNNGECYSAQ